MPGGTSHGSPESELRADASSSGFLKQGCLTINYRIGLAGYSYLTSATTFPQPYLNRAGIVLRVGARCCRAGVFFFASSALLGPEKRKPLRVVAGSAGSARLAERYILAS
jgi:hypothetical protein